MFDIIKDLKENIKKHNMKKLVLSAVLGMFCYCANNAMEENGEGKPKPTIEIIDINKVLMTMLEGQNNINEAKKAFKKQEPRIYSTIKDEEEKVKKRELLNFIESQIKFIKTKTKDTKVDRLKFAMKKIEQYFHLEEKENDYECTKDNLTEIFWNNEQKGETQKIKGPIKVIQRYFIRIAINETKINNTFKKYYDAKKKENVTAQEGDILRKIMHECYGKEKKGDLQTKFLANLENLCAKYPNLKVNKNAILATIKRRIALDKDIIEENFISFLKQKIGIEEIKEDKFKNEKKIEEEVCCSCSDCWGKKKNKEVEVEESQYELE